MRGKYRRYHRAIGHLAVTAHPAWHRKSCRPRFFLFFSSFRNKLVSRSSLAIPRLPSPFRALPSLPLSLSLSLSLSLVTSVLASVLFSVFSSVLSSVLPLGARRLSLVARALSVRLLAPALAAASLAHLSRQMAEREWHIYVQPIRPTVPSAVHGEETAQIQDQQRQGRPQHPGTANRRRDMRLPAGI